jgi:acetyl-CoA carboxylase carboxyl transferase subunit beta
MIRPRGELRTTLGRLLSVATRRSPDNGRYPVTVDDALVTDPHQLPVRDPWACVQAARRVGRPTTLDYIAMLVEDFVELHGDRTSADCRALVAGLGRLEGVPMVVIGTQKGHNAAELAARNYGMPTPAGYRKAARVMRLAAKLGLPVVTLIDTAGAYPGVEAEEQGQAVAIAENLRLMASLPVPVVAVITGEGGSGGALALAVADRVLMCSNAVYSVISAEGCAAILWKDPSAAPKAAAALKLDARELLRMGVVDGVIPEPADGVHADHLAAGESMRAALATALAGLLSMDQLSLVAGRHARFRRFGTDSSTVPGIDMSPDPDDDWELVR